MAPGGGKFAARVAEVAARKKAQRPRKEPAVDPAPAEILPPMEDALAAEQGTEAFQGGVATDQPDLVVSESAEPGIQTSLFLSVSSNFYGKAHPLMFW